jgi:peptide-methionine (R)-S-oxide reductase
MKRRYWLAIGLGVASVPPLLRYLSEGTTLSAEAGSGFEITKSEKEWRRILTPQQFKVLRLEGTEAPGSHPLNHEYGKGRYSCAGCDLPLFNSETKFDSGTGWPSFYAPIAGAVAQRTDDKFLLGRTEVHCRRCGGHLGHVFEDGPKPTGLRYCINGVSLKFTRA